MNVSTQSFPATACARPRQLVDVRQLAALLEAPGVLLFEVGCDQLAQFHAAHIPGARYLDTSALERPPYFNKVDDDALLALLLAHGIDHQTTVIVYGRSTVAAARAAHLMLYAGVADVRLLDGGFALWCAAGLPCVGGPARALEPARAFGVRFPLNSRFMHNTAQVRACPTALVSVRTWSEFSGRSSGYSYIPAHGDIPGARWGRAGREGDVNSMSEYQHPDGRMLPAAAIDAMWQASGIVRGVPAVFYCGTGWRASLAFFYAWVMGWANISVYDGGWLEWSADGANPVIVRCGAALAA